MKTCFLFAIILVSCDNRYQNTDVEEKDDIARIRQTLARFSLLDCDSLTDEGSFIFYKEQRWDTSFLLVLRKTKKGAIGLYHEVTPVNMESAYLTGAEFFDGFRFEIDSGTWYNIIDKARPLIDTVSHYSDHCLDCGHYIMSHRGKFTHNTYNGRDTNPFEGYERFASRSSRANRPEKKRMENGAMTENEVPVEG